MKTDMERLNLEELPPRARRILPKAVYRVLHSGTTSACAENTSGPNTLWLGFRNYLRVRGEYVRNAAGENIKSELPPRARRIP